MVTERVMRVNAPDVDRDGIPGFPADDWKHTIGKMHSGSCHTEVTMGRQNVSIA